MHQVYDVEIGGRGIYKLLTGGKYQIIIKLGHLKGKKRFILISHVILWTELQCIITVV